MTSERVEGHAFAAYERGERWTPSTGTWGRYWASCECGESTESGVSNLSAARQWHHEHKSAVLAGVPVTGKDDSND